MTIFEGKRALITGGTGTLGQAIVRRLLSGEQGQPDQLAIFSRNSTRSHQAFQEQLGDAARHLRFVAGDVQDYDSVLAAVQDIDVVIHAAALKHVHTCEYFPTETIKTNVQGTINIMSAINQSHSPVETFVGISTEQACSPISVMGMSKAMMERILVEANVGSKTRFISVRYGNIIPSHGSVVPFFLKQIARGGPVTVTSEDMTRFMLNVDRAVDALFAAIRDARPGEIYAPGAPAARITDLALALIDGRDIPIEYTGIRPGEKLHAVLISEEESRRSIERNGYYVICPMLPELAPASGQQPVLGKEISSEHFLLPVEELKPLLAEFLEHNPV